MLPPKHASTRGAHKRPIRPAPTLQYALTAVALLLLSAMLFSAHHLLPVWTSRKSNNSNNNNNQRTTLLRHRRNHPPLLAAVRTLPKNPTHRLAILLPYTIAGDANVGAILPYLLLFCTGAAGAADVADFWVFHTGVLTAWDQLERECPANVFFINLESHAVLAELILRRVLDHHKPHNTKPQPGDAPGGEDWAMDRDELHALLTSYLQVNPYALVEFKPALGHIFSDFLSLSDDKSTSTTSLSSYTHWGYTDLDVVFGDLGRWITSDEWHDFDIVTYTFGDQQRLYLRGQFTMFRNVDRINQLWRNCTYLSHIDERFRRLVDRSRPYHVESAEGCFSAAVLNQTDITVKFAVKAWTDIYANDTAYTHGVFLSRNGTTGRHVLYKKSASSAAARHQPQRLPTAWKAHEDAVYRNPDTLLQYEVGSREPMAYETDPDANCMYWALKEYQSKLCLRTKVASDETVFWIHGQLYKQRHEHAVLDTPVVATAPFFHFQEWKRSYRYGQIAAMHPLSPVATFCLLPEGVAPVIEDEQSTDMAESAPPASPLGLSPLHSWTSVANDDRTQLPGHVYCVVPGMMEKGAPHGGRCVTAITWQNQAVVEILSGAPGWTQADIDSDVTLVLTREISTAQASNPPALKHIVDHCLTSLHAWHGQPSVVVLTVAGATVETKEYLREHLRPSSSASVLHSALVAVVYLDDKSSATTQKGFVSRKALLNMAMDAVPTRWYLSGLELERGLFLSPNTAFFAHATAAAHGRLRGNIFLVPQFGLPNDLDRQNENQGNNVPTAVVTLGELVTAQQKRKTLYLSQLEEECNNDDTSRGSVDRLGIVDIAWLDESKAILDPATRDVSNAGISRRAATLVELEQAILELVATDDHRKHLRHTFDDSPLLLTDNLGPHAGIRTDEISREVETFAGWRCFNSLRLVQLAILGYRFNVLGGAFAAASAKSRELAQSGASSADSSTRCVGCTTVANDQHHVWDAIAKVELKRAAKTAILWAETTGLKKENVSDEKAR